MVLYLEDGSNLLFRNVGISSVTLPTIVRMASVSNLGLDNDYPNIRSEVSPSPSTEMSTYTAQKAMTASFQISSNFPFSNHPTIGRYIVTVTQCVAMWMTK
jgi:hypothetical protein